MRASAAGLAAVVVATLAALFGPGPRAVAEDRTAGPSTAPAVNLLNQSPWVETRGDFHLRVSFNGLQPTDQVSVTVFDQILTRTDFELAAEGKVEQYTLDHQVVPVSALTPDPAGGFDIDLPVDQAAAAGQPWSEVQIAGEENGVYAVQVQLVGAPGPPLTTFLTYSQGTAKAQGFSPLNVAVVVPFTSTPVVGSQGQLQPPGPSETARLGALAESLNDDNSVPVSLQVSPVTLDALKIGAEHSAVDRATLANMSGAPAGGLMEVLPTTWSPVSLGDLTDSGLGSEIGPQIDTANSDLESILGYRPASQTWAVDDRLDGPTLQDIESRGGTQLIVPDSDLTAPAEVSNFTVVNATQLGSSSTSVYAADPGLSADFARPVPPVLAANILLADMAMVFTEEPGNVGGIVAMPPPGSVVDPTLVDTLLAGMSGDPLLNPVTASGLFDVAGKTKGSRDLASPDPGPTRAESDLAAAAKDITTARASINEMASVLPGQAAQSTTVASELLLAESETLDGAQRAAVLSAIAASTAVLDDAVTLPPATSITLTSTEGQIPITILSAPNVHPRVELRLKSPRLIFVLLKPPDGTCSVPDPEEEDCVLSLKDQNTTLKVPVETRSSGVFPLDVTLTPPGSSGPVLRHDEDTVRSTAVSGVAIILIVLALGGLAYWWVRDVRRGRRPKGMLPTPGGPEAGRGDDYVEEFFGQPPPTYRRS